VWQGLTRATREDRLVEWSPLASAAAAAAIATASPETALTHLEQCRSVLWTQALNLRSSLSKLTAIDQLLALRLDEIRTLMGQAHQRGHASVDTGQRAIGGPTA
jgi:hypothetical protein